MIITYLIKSTLCLAVLFGFYKVALESKALHQFKRFYLLTSLIFSLTIPLVTFTYTTAEVPQDIWVEDFVQTYDQSAIISPPLPIIEEQTNYLSYILWSIYGAGFLFFGGRFTLNLLRLKRKITQAETLEQPSFTLALLSQSIVPHSFLKYIFLSRKRYQNREIPSEVIAHEATHVRQKHSLDILFIEFLQVIFWFNPLFWITKKSITLNHEFLADQGAIQEQHDIYQYQHILLNYAGSAHQTTLESPFNYSSTKKRILMLSQSFSRKRLVISALLLIPIILGCVLVFNQGIIAEVNANDLAIEGHWIDQKQERNPILISNESGLLSLRRGNSNNTTPIIEESGAYFIESTEEGKKEIKIDPTDNTLVIGEQKYIPPSESLKTQFSGLWENKEKLISFLIRNNDGTFTWTITEKGQEDGKMYFPNLTDTGFEFMRDDEWSSFTIKQGVIVDDKGNIYQRGKTPENLSVKILGEDRYTVNDRPATNASLMDVLKSFNTNRTKEERQQVITAMIDEPTEDHADQVDMLYDTLHEYGVKGVSIYKGLTFSNTASKHPLKEKHPTKQDLKRWLDASQYGIWINKERVTNEVLTAYKPVDLLHFTESKIEKNAVNYGKYDVQVNLMTNTYWRENGGFPEGHEDYLDSLSQQTSKIYARSIEINILDNASLEVEGIKTSKKNLQKTLESLHTDLTKEQRDRVINIHVSSQGNIPYKDLVFIQKVATDYGYHRIVTPDEEIVRSKGNAPMVQNTAERTTSNPKNITLEIIEDGKYLINGKAATDENLSEVLHTFNTNLTKEERQNQVDIIISAPEKINVDQIKKLRNQLVEYGVRQLQIPEGLIIPATNSKNYLNVNHPTKQDLTRWLDASQYGIWLDGVQIKNDVLKEYHPDDLPYYIESKLEKNAYNYGKHYVQVNIMTTPYWQEKRGIGFPTLFNVNLENTENIHLKATNLSQEKAKNYVTQFINGAERNGKKAFVIEINKNTIRIDGKASSVSTLRQDIDAITKDWEETDYTETYPSILVKNPDKGFIEKLNKEFLKTHYSKANGGMDLIPPPPPAPPAPPAPSQLPPPPPPPSVEDHLKSMNEIGGVFYYENKEVTFDKALNLVKTNKNLNVQTRHPYTNMPKTYISKEPIVVPNQKENTDPVTKKDIAVYNKLAKKYNKNPNGQILRSEVTFMYDIYNRMTEKQKKNAESYPALPPPPAPKAAKTPKPPKPPGGNQLAATQQLLGMKTKQEQIESHQNQGGVFVLNKKTVSKKDLLDFYTSGKEEFIRVRVDKKVTPIVMYVDNIPKEMVYTPITEKEIKEYNTLAKKYSNNPNGEIKKRELRTLYHVYVNMTEKQKAAAEPYPAIAPPPAQNKTKKPGTLIGVRGLSLEDRNSFNTSILGPSQKIIQEDARYYYNHKHISIAEAKELIANTPNIKQRTKPSKTFGKPLIFLYTTDLFEPAPRPTAVNIIAHIKVSNRHQSQFYYGSERITYQEALKLVRKNRSLQVITTINEQEQYQTKISKA